MVIEHDVFRFEVPIDDPVRVKVTQSQSDLPQIKTEEVKSFFRSMNAHGNKHIRAGEGEGPPHQAVSSMKMPSFSSCMNSSPPVKTVSTKDSGMRHCGYHCVIMRLVVLDYEKEKKTAAGVLEMALPERKINGFIDFSSLLPLRHSRMR